MNYYDKTLIETMRWGRIGMISCLLAHKLSIKPIEALKRFYRSNTCKLFHDRKTGLYLYGDLYIVESYLSEIVSSGNNNRNE